MISRGAMWVVLLVLVLVMLVTAALLLSSCATAQVTTILGGYDADAAAAVVPVNSANDAPQVNRAALMERAALLRRADQLSALPAVIVGDESVSAPLGDGGAAPLIAVGSPASQDDALIARAKDALVYIVVIDKPGDEGALLAAAGVDIGTTVPISKRTSSGGAPATGWLYQVVKVPGGGTRRVFINYINPAEKRYTQ
jgi:hypothetical protein